MDSSGAKVSYPLNDRNENSSQFKELHLNKTLNNTIIN